MPAGFLYVLINPSMPGLTKVGKTTRDPSDRVTELSSATGVPSPFMLAFQQPVGECDVAERWVHQELERRGFRLSDNREFFNAPLHEIIQTVTKSASLAFPESAEITDATVTSNEQLADELYALACDYRRGTDSVLKNDKTALRYFEQATALGHAQSASLAAHYYHFGGEGIGQNLEKALAFYKSSVTFGNWCDEAAIAELFLSSGQKEAAETHYVKFFEDAAREFDCPNDVTYERISSYGINYFVDVVMGKINHCVPDLIVNQLSVQLLKGIDEQMADLQKRYETPGAATYTKLMLKARDFVLGR